jgi:hypothetical protein
MSEAKLCYHQLTPGGRLSQNRVLHKTVSPINFASSLAGLNFQARPCSKTGPSVAEIAYQPNRLVERVPVREVEDSENRPP